MNDDLRGMYNTNSQIKFKNSMLKSCLFDYSESYVLVSGTITFVGGGAGDVTRTVDRNNTQTIFKNCAPFNDRITETNNTKVDNAKDLDVVMAMYNLDKI